MDAIWRDEPVIGFGGDSLNPHAPRPVEMVGSTTLDDLRRQVMQTCPRVPGVYGMLNPKAS